jgi:excisionase family DNA binding protein
MQSMPNVGGQHMATPLTNQAGNLSLAEAALRLGVSRHTLRNWAKYQRRLPYLRLGRRLLFAVADLRLSRNAVA